MQSCWNTTRHHISLSFKWFCKDLPTLKCSEQTSVPAAIIYSFPSSQRIPWIHYFPLDANVEQFLSLLVAFKNAKTSRHSEIKQTRPSTKQDFSGEALSKQNTEASLASLSWLVPGDDRVVHHICIRCIVNGLYSSYTCKGSTETEGIVNKETCGAIKGTNSFV